MAKFSFVIFIDGTSLEVVDNIDGWRVALGQSAMVFAQADKLSNKSGVTRLVGLQNNILAIGI
ncbi:hypothetical protein A9Q96_09825 [Rhodobacterales bacterium 52_120_T64]|nr:hypothetical protein A9Q96_09825 [Rhodobacterales bacterium 52_120_T64]